jgi:hypothetical protein
MSFKQIITCIFFNSATSLVGVYGIHKFAQNQILEEQKVQLEDIKDKYAKLKKVSDEKFIKELGFTPP